MGKRRKARELALQNLYAFEVSGNPIESVIDHLNAVADGDEELLAFAASLLRKAVHHRQTLDQYVTETVKNWRFERIALVDRMILRLALAEILYFDEIPPKVTLNEAIDLAKKYSTEESGRFVNGVLDALLNRFKKENLLVKRGRGLLG